MTAHTPPSSSAARAEPLSAPPAPEAHVAWPAERFFWALLETPSFGPGRTSTGAPKGDALLPLLEHETPAPHESLHAIFVPLACGRTLVCALPHETLDRAEASTLTLTPRSLPDFIARALSADNPASTSTPSARPGTEQRLDPSSLNMLVGTRTPRAVRRRRRTRSLMLSACTAGIAGLLALGLRGRAVGWSRDGATLRAATATLLSSLAPPGPDGDGQANAPDAQELLLAEIDALRATRDFAADHASRPAQRDAAATLSAVLAAWPDHDRAQPESLSVTDDSVTINALVHERVGEFVALLRAPTGWTMQEPRLTSMPGSGARITIALRPAAPQREPGVGASP